jgi:hypothetical protein
MEQVKAHPWLQGPTATLEDIKENFAYRQIINNVAIEKMKK